MKLLFREIRGNSFAFFAESETVADHSGKTNLKLVYIQSIFVYCHYYRCKFIVVIQCIDVTNLLRSSFITMNRTHIHRIVGYTQKCVTQTETGTVYSFYLTTPFSSFSSIFLFHTVACPFCILIIHFFIKLVFVFVFVLVLKWKYDFGKLITSQFFVSFNISQVDITTSTNLDVTFNSRCLCCCFNTSLISSLFGQNNL